ncbi:AzlC family ABC transporter permease [Peribacillus sp. NPDC101480]|uniref:AzlC family ABC transporter permease n=1 Tax=Peribacillus sp. NPDC101480 TaxID=3390620 RepID=UPI003D056087
MIYTIHKEKHPFQQGALDAIPISVSTFIFGAIFGVVSIQSGLTVLESSLMSFVSFAGSAQLSVLELLGHTGFFTLFMTTFLLNARHLLYGLTLTPHVQHEKKATINTIAFLLSDSMFVLANAKLKKEPIQSSYLIGAGVVVYLSWGIGTAIGAYFTQFMNSDNTYGLEFASTACFILLVIGDLVSLRRILTLILCAIFVLVCYTFFPTGVLLLLSGLVAFVIGYFSSEDV